MPLFVRKFIVDFLETGLAALFALTIAFPVNLDQASQVAVIVGAALLGACVSAARRAYPSFVEWVKAALNVTP